MAPSILCWTLLSAILVLTLPTRSARAEIFYVGPGVDCDVSTLDGAVIGAAFTIAEDDEIRITTTLSNISRELRNFDPSTIGAVTISGGYDDCNGTQNGGYGALIGFGSDPVIEVISDGATSKVTLRDLIITRFGTARGITATGSSAELYLENTRVEFNDGGGIEATNGALVDIDLYSEIQNNDAFGDPGGGISCSGARLVVTGEVAENATSSSGGGVFANAGCEVTLEGGARLYFNDATWGGGVAVSAGSELDTNQTEFSPVALVGNAATQEGGGIYAVNAADVVLQDVILQANKAGQRGAGLFVDADSDLVMFAANYHCNAGCSGLYNNELTGNPGFREGTAVYAGGASSVRLFQTGIRGNTEFDQRGYPLFATDPGTTLFLESVLLASNHAESLLNAEAGAAITAAFLTASKNFFSLVGTWQSPSGGRSVGGSSIEIYSSILQDHDDFVVDPTSTASLDCLLVETINGTTSAQRLALVDPRLTNPDGGNFRPAPGSPAIDFCDTSLYIPLVLDLDGQPRGWDVPSHPNFVGPYDIGAYEHFGLLFGDGFETGDTTSWSASTP